MKKILNNLLQFKTFSLVYFLIVLIICAVITIAGIATTAEEIVYEGDGSDIAACEYARGIYAIDVDYMAGCYGMIQVLPDGNMDLWAVDHANAFMPDYTNHVTSLFIVNQDRGGEIGVAIYPVSEDAEFTLDRVTITRKRNMSATYSALRFLFAALIVYGIAAFIYAFYDRESDRTKKLLRIGIVLLWFISMVGFMQGYLPGGQDSDFHLTRIAGIADGLRSGHFPVRIYMDYVNDYGYPLGIMYGDLFLYPSAILHMMGLPLWQCYVFYVGYISLLTAVIASYVFGEIADDPYIGFAGAVIYTLSAWRLNDVYIRAAAGEYAAMAFLPLIALGFYYVFAHDGEEKEDRKAFFAFVIGYFGVIQTHMLSSIMITIFLVVIGVILIKRVMSARKVLLIVKSAVCAILVNLAFIIPMIDYYVSHDLTLEDQSINIQTQGAYWSQLFTGAGNMILGSKAITDSIGINEDMPLGLGIVLVLVLLSTLVVMLADRDCRYNPVFGICDAVAVVSLWMSTCYFPYDLIARRLTFLARLICRVQFPWRYLVITTLSLTIAAVFLLKYVLENKKEYFAVISAFLMILTMVQAVSFIAQRIGENEILITAVSSDHIASPMIDKDTLYWIQGMSRDDLVSRDIYTSGDGVSASMVRCAMPSCDIAFSNSTENAYIEPPILNFKGYHAYYNGEELTVSDGDAYRIRIELPVADDGLINIEFREPVLWRIAEIISLGTWIALAVWSFLRIRKQNNN